MTGKAEPECSLPIHWWHWNWQPDASTSNDVYRNVSAQHITSDGRLGGSLLDQNDGSWLYHQQRVQQLAAHANMLPEGNSSNRQDGRYKAAVVVSACKKADQG